MKKIKIGVLLLVIVFAICAVTSCKSDGKNKNEEFINSFLSELQAKNYEKAETYLHPERPASLSEFFQAFEKGVGIDFADGFENINYESTSFTAYDSSVEGSSYIAQITADVSSKQLKMEIEIVENDNGYGIYNFLAE